RRSTLKCTSDNAGWHNKAARKIVCISYRLISLALAHALKAKFSKMAVKAITTGINLINNIDVR
ncbi:hypothetical protein OYA85_24865, partial [Escherichia coli]|nr:hypothetical protein [Escherichia coli]